jgi:hypothetical protein
MKYDSLTFFVFLVSGAHHIVCHCFTRGLTTNTLSSEGMIIHITLTLEMTIKVICGSVMTFKPRTECACMKCIYLFAKECVSYTVIVPAWLFQPL